MTFNHLAENKNIRRSLYILLIVYAVILRYLLIFWAHPLDDYIFSDMSLFNNSALNILNLSSGPRDSLSPPGFPVLISLSMKFFGSYILIKVLHFILPLLSIVLVLKGFSRFFGKESNLILTILLLFNMFQVHLSSFLMAGTIFSFFVALLFFELSKDGFELKQGSLVKIAIILGASFFFKANLIFFVPLFIIWYFVKRLDLNLKSRLLTLVPFMLILSLFVSFISLYQNKVNKAPALLANNSGISFMQAKCPEKLGIDKGGFYFLSPTYTQLGKVKQRVFNQPFSNSKYFWKEGLKCVTENPLVLLTSMIGVKYLFAGVDFWPGNQSFLKEGNHYFQFFYNIFILPGFLLALFFILKEKDPKKVLPLLLVLSVFILPLIFVGEIRYRIPFDFVLIPLAIFGYSKILKNHSHQRIYFSLMGLILIMLVSSSYLPKIFKHTKLSKEPQNKTVIKRENSVIKQLIIGDSFKLSLKITPLTPQPKHSTVFSNHDGPKHSGIVLEMRGPERYSFLFGNGTGWTEVFRFKLPPNKMTVLEFRKKDLRYELFINGKLNSSRYLSSKIKQSQLPLLLGNWAQGDRNFNGNLSELVLSP